MPLLGDYISSLVSSVTEARAKADIQSANVARLYLKDDLLRNFTVPHMKIEEITMDVPIAIDYASGDTVINYYLDVDSATEAVIKIFLKLSSQNNSSQTVNLDAIRTIIKEKVQLLKNDVERVQNLDTLRSKATEIADESYNSYFRERLFDKREFGPTLISAIESTLRTEFITTELDAVGILADASRLKEQSPQSIINIKIKMVEESMTWAIGEGDNKEVKAKLIPE